MVVLSKYMKNKSGEILDITWIITNAIVILLYSYRIRLEKIQNELSAPTQFKVDQ